MRVAAESTLVVSDSADIDSTTMTWVPEHFDTVRAFRIEHDANGMPMHSWIDAQGRLVFASDTSRDSRWSARAFEIVYENFKKRDTARVARSGATPGPGDIVPLTALAAGVTRRSNGARAHGAARERQGHASRSSRQGHSRRTPRPIGSRRAIPRWHVGWLAEPLIQSRDPRIGAQARQIIERERSPARVAQLLTHWVAPLACTAPPRAP